MKHYKKSRKRGIYVKKLSTDYCVLDLETTGLSWQDDEIIEIGIVKVRNNQIVDKYSQLIHPQCQISSFITQLTGITNDMVKEMPKLQDVQNEVLDFIGNDIIIGHNTSFDLNFLANAFQKDIYNEYMDTLQFSRKIYPHLRHHRLTDMVHLLNLSNNEHRSLADCIATYELYEHCKKRIIHEHIMI